MLLGKTVGINSIVIFSSCSLIDYLVLVLCWFWGFCFGFVGYYKLMVNCLFTFMYVDSRILLVLSFRCFLLDLRGTLECSLSI